jgi:AbrB family looped-hinge helix DNA binding protein
MASVQRTRRLDGQGRVSIPAEYRAALGLRQGDALTIELVDGELRMRSLRAVVQGAQVIVHRHISKRRSPSDELIAGRRDESKRE